MNDILKQWWFHLGITLNLLLLVSLTMAAMSINEYVNNTQAVNSPKLMSSIWHLDGQKSLSDRELTVDPQLINQADSIRLTYDLHGLCLLPGEASALELRNDQGQKDFVSLANFGQNCLNGKQTVDIPTNNFADSSNANKIGVSIWHQMPYGITISEIELVRTQKKLDLKTMIEKRRARLEKVLSKRPIAFVNPDPKIPTPYIGESPTLTATPTLAPTPTPTPAPILASASPAATLFPTSRPNPVISPSPSPTPSPTPAATPQPSSLPLPSESNWDIRSVSSMKDTKDKLCSPSDRKYIEKWVDQAKELGVNYIALETPYNNPDCNNAYDYTKTWVEVIRSRGLNVWHRHMFLEFEGIYERQKNPQLDYISATAQYIQDHPELFAQNDIFTPAPEPQNGGIQDITYCHQDICIFQSKEEFNSWIRDITLASREAFENIGLDNMKVGYFGFDGFVAWGSMNSDWEGILEKETVEIMGNITIDHYPQMVGDSMENALNELSAKYPDTPIIIGEWGAVKPTDQKAQIEDSMRAALKFPQVKGFNYWHMGPEGQEALINSDLVPKDNFYLVQEFFRRSSQ